MLLVRETEHNIGQTESACDEHVEMWLAVFYPSDDNKTFLERKTVEGDSPVCEIVVGFNRSRVGHAGNHVRI